MAQRKAKETRKPRRRTHKQRLAEVYAYGDIMYWLIREDLEEQTGLEWKDIPWSRVAEHAGCSAQTLQRLWSRQTKFVRFDTLQKLADCTGMGLLLQNLTRELSAKQSGLKIAG